MGLFDNALDSYEDTKTVIKKQERKPVKPKTMTIIGSQDPKKKRFTPDFGDDESDIPIDVNQRKVYEEYRSKLIANEKSLRNLVEKELVTSILGEIGQSFQNNVVDQAKRKAPLWAAQLGIPDKERDIERLLSDLGEEEITGVQADIERLSDEGVFDGE